MYLSHSLHLVFGSVRATSLQSTRALSVPALRRSEPHSSIRTWNFAGTSPLREPLLLLQPQMLILEELGITADDLTNTSIWSRISLEKTMKQTKLFLLSFTLLTLPRPRNGSMVSHNMYQQERFSCHVHRIHPVPFAHSVRVCHHLP